MSRPSKTIEPSIGCTRPETAFNSVDFPAPFVPKRATISPWADLHVDPEQHPHLVVGDVHAPAHEERSSSRCRLADASGAPGDRRRSTGDEQRGATSGGSGG